MQGNNRLRTSVFKTLIIGYFQRVFEKLDEYTTACSLQKEKRVTYKRTLDEFKQSIAAAKTGEYTNEGNENESSWQKPNLASVKEEHHALTERIAKLEEIIAEKRSSLEKRLCDLEKHPTNAELCHYQKRLNELQKQMELLNWETENCYLHFNGLSDVASILRKQKSLLESVFSNFPAALKSPYDQFEFKKSLKRVLESASTTHHKLRSQTKSRSEECQKALQQYEIMERKTTTYHRLVAELKEKLAALSRRNRTSSNS